MPRSRSYVDGAIKALELAEKEAVGVVADAIEEDIKRNMPVETGTALRSVRRTPIVTKRTPRGGSSSEVHAGGGEAFYVEWLEKGNSRQPATPILRPASERAVGYMPKVVGILVKTNLEIALPNE